jgi:hypothetical protein
MTERRSLETGQAAETGRSRSYLFALLIFLPFLFLAIVYLRTSFQLILARNDVTYPEGACVYAFLTALHTGKLYSPPFDFPFNVQIYGPVFYLVGLGFAKAAHGDPTMTTALFRLLSFLSLLGSAGLIGFLSWKLEGKRRWAAASVVLSLACAWAPEFSASARPDLLSIFLMLSALTVYQLAQGRSRLILWVGVLGSLSCLTKQSTAPILFALLIDTLIARRFRNSAALIAGATPIPALVFLTLWLRHDPFLANLSGLQHAFYSWQLLGPTVLNIVRCDQMAIVPLLVALLGVGLSWRKEKYRTVLLALGIGSISNLAALANTGGNTNYLILPWLLMAVMAPAGLAGIEAWARRSVILPLGLTALGGLLLIHNANVLLPKLPPNLDTYNVDKLKMLSALPYLELRSREPQLLDPYLYHQFSLQNVWSMAPIVQRIDEEEYDLIVISGSDGPADSEFRVSYRGTSGWGADTLGPMMSHYRVLCEVPSFLALVPRNRPGAVREKDIARIFGQPCLATVRTPQLAPGVR